MWEGRTSSSSHILNNNIHVKKNKVWPKQMHPQRPLSARIRERSAAVREARVLHTGDPAQLEFRLWLMTQQIKPVIFRQDISCHFSSTKQQPPSKTAVSQQCDPFSARPLLRKTVGAASPKVVRTWQWAQAPLSNSGATRSGWGWDSFLLESHSKEESLFRKISAPLINWQGGTNPWVIIFA